MASPLDSSVTLRDALDLVEARRIPVAPEVSGYLCLELAERAYMQRGGLVEESVFLGEEGSVAFIPQAHTTPPEQFVRQLLERLLNASGARTPALSNVAHTKDKRGLDGLVSELEAALIPLNRGAGRRSLARLAREVRRVTLGVGRNAAPQSTRAATRPSNPPPAPAERRPVTRPAGDATVAGPAMDPAPAAESMAPAASPPPDGAPPAPAPAVDALAPTPPTEVEPSEPPPAAVNAPASPATTPSAAPPSASPAVDPVDSLLAALDDGGGSGDRGERTLSQAEAARHELKAMAGLAPTPPPGTVIPDDDAPPSPLGGNDDDDDSEALEPADHTAAQPETPAEAASTPPPPPEPSAATRAPIDDEPPPSRAPASKSRALHAPESRRAPLSTKPAQRPLPAPQAATRTGRWVALVLLLVLGLGFVAVYWLKPAWMLGHPPLQEPAPVVGAVAVPEPERCGLQVRGAPRGAEILLLTGKAPLDVAPLPTGRRIEFVSLLDGHATKRSVIPASATWTQDSKGKPRYELAVELPLRKSGSAEPWPAAEPGSAVGGDGKPGTVRVISSPPGAEVWLLFGLGAEAAFDPLPCGQRYTVLVAEGNSLRQRIEIAADDFVPQTGGTAWATRDLGATR